MSLRASIWVGAAVAAAMMGQADASSAAAKKSDAEGAALVHLAAQPYVQLREDIDAISAAKPSDAQMMRDAHNRLASHDARMMGGAWIAYAAMIAADEPAFSQAIQAKVKEMGKAAFVEELENNPVIVRNMPGSEAATTAILSFARNDAARIQKVGENYIASAYDMQNVAWARRELAERGMERVNAALAFAATRQWPSAKRSNNASTKRGMMRPNLAQNAAWSPSWSGYDSGIDPKAKGGVIVTKALVLGARYAINDVEQEDLAVYGTSKKSERCFTSAKLNLDQCIAATRTSYEEAFCIGQHGLSDVSHCVGWPAANAASSS